jgi:hypothetical protein
MEQHRPFPLWTVLGAFLLGMVLFAIVVALLLSIPPGAAPASTQIAIVTVIPAATRTNPGPVVTPTSAASPTLPPPPSVGTITIGSLVQVAGTGGDGLRLRVEPGLEEQVRFLGIEAEVFEVVDGPVELDGFVWYLLMTPIDEARRGWAVSNYLVTVQNP